MMRRSSLILISFIILLTAACKIDPFVEGKQLYDAYCASCHMTDGNGLKEVYPNLFDPNSSALQKKSLACMIRYGQLSSEEFRADMPPSPKLTEIEISNIVNYVNTQFYKSSPINIKTIRSQLAACQSNE